MSDIAEVIKNIPLFSALSREDVAKIVGKLEESSYGAGQTIFSQGDKGDSFYLIQSGSVQVASKNPGRKPEILAVLGPREWFGEMALLSGEARSATITAVKDTVAWKLRRESWDELIEKHPGWLLHFCATLSKRLSKIDQQFSHGRDAFNSLAEEFYEALTPSDQGFLRHISLLTTISPALVRAHYDAVATEHCLQLLEKCRAPLVWRIDGVYEFHEFFREFLTNKLQDMEGVEHARNTHRRFAVFYESLKNWEQAIHHQLEAHQWPSASRILITHKDDFLSQNDSFLKLSLDRFPSEYLFSNFQLVHLKAEIEARSGDLTSAIATYNQALARSGSTVAAANAVGRYRTMAEALMRRRDLPQALQCVRAGLKLVEQESDIFSSAPDAKNLNAGERYLPPRALVGVPSLRAFFAKATHFVRAAIQGAPRNRWTGGILGISVWAYLWFLTPEIGLEPLALKQLAFLSMTLIFWVFWVLPEHGVALIFALGLILCDLAKPDLVLGGFASTTWFMSLGVLALGAAITGSGLFYRLSLQLVRCFPLTYFWQTMALGLTGVTVAALIPQKSARATITSQMLVNLAESLGYKTPSKASTGFFAASFLGLGQLNFLYLTGSTATLLAWGLLPENVRAQFTWGHWFIAIFPPALVTITIVLIATYFLYRPETPPAISYRMVRSQIEILGALSREEWITLAILCLTVSGWLTFSYHKIHGAWISLAALCVLINTGVLGWATFKKGIDWEFLIYLGATQNIPNLLAAAKIDTWLTGFFSPLIFPFIEYRAIAFIVIALLGFALKFFVTQRLTVITLIVALVPLAGQLGVNPWVITMVILIGSEPWFFRHQIDWHTLAYATTEGKGFSYPLMYRINPVYAFAYILTIIAAVPYWKYLGLIK